MGSLFNEFVGLGCQCVELGSLSVEFDYGFVVIGSQFIELGFQCVELGSQSVEFCKWL